MVSGRPFLTACRRCEADAAKRKAELSGTRSNPEQVGADRPQPAGGDATPEKKRQPRAADKAAKASGDSRGPCGRRGEA